MAKVIQPSAANIRDLQQALAERQALNEKLSNLTVRIELISEKMLREARITRMNAAINIKQDGTFEVIDK